MEKHEKTVLGIGKVLFLLNVLCFIGNVVCVFLGYWENLAPAILTGFVTFIFIEGR